MIKQNIFLISAILLIAGCAGLDIKHPDDGWQVVELSRSPLAPSSEDLEETKILVSKFEEPSNETLKKISSLASLADAMTASTEKLISEVGVEIIDRQDPAAVLLANEIQLAEAQGRKGVYEGPKVAKYTFFGRIVSVSTDAKYQAQQKKQAAKCQYEANVTGILRIYTVMPRVKVIKSLDLRSSASTSEDAGSPSCDENPEKHTTIIRTAGEKAVESLRSEFENFFLPTGYITEMRTDGKKYIVKVSIGKKQGLKMGDRVHIFTKKQSKTSLGIVDEEERKINSGQVTNQIADNYAWILIEKHKTAEEIKLGDIFKVTFEKESSFDALKRQLGM